MAGARWTMSETPAGGQAAYVRFGVAGDAAALQIDGWSVPEDGFTWSLGEGSRIRIPYRAGQGTLWLELTVTPMRAVPAVPHQVLTVVVDGTQCGTETVGMACTLAFPLRGIAGGSSGEIELCLMHPGAAVPADCTESDDQRRLGVAVHEILLHWHPAEPDFTPRFRSALPVPHPDMLFENVRGCTGLDPAALMFQFESIGHNCEFGLVQRILKAEPLGLLRFGGIPPADLLRGLDCGFDGIDDPAQIAFDTEVNEGRDEYVVRADRYAMRFHSFVSVADTPHAEMLHKMAVHLSFLRRMFEEKLRGGETIFVLHHAACGSVAQVRPFLNVLRSWGPTALLFVTAGTGEMGSVDQVAADMFHGHIDRFMTQFDANEINAPAWLSICANTYRMWRETALLSA